MYIYCTLIVHVLCLMTCCCNIRISQSGVSKVLSIYQSLMLQENPVIDKSGLSNCLFLNVALCPKTFLYLAPGLYHAAEGGLQSAVICSNVERERVREFEAECVHLSVYVCVWWGEGTNRESPFHCMACSKCRLRDPERGGDGEGARTPWERWECVCV